MNLKNTSIMKNYIKYLCTFLLLLGTSTQAWAAAYLEYNSTKYYNGQTITINLNEVTLPSHGSPSFKVGNDAATGWTEDTYGNRGIIYTTITGTGASFLLGSYSASQGSPVDPNDDLKSYYTYTSAQYWNATFQLGYYFASAGTTNITFTITQKDQAYPNATLETATITIRFVVNFTGYTITYNLTGLDHASIYNPTNTSGAFHAVFEVLENYGTPISGTYSDGFVTDEPITIGTSGDCYYNLGDLYYTSTPVGNVTINLTATLECTELAAPTGLTLSENHPTDAAPLVPVHGRTRFGWNSVSNASGYKVTVSNGVTTASATTASDRYYYITTFPAGNYTWSVKAIGDGSTYCEENDATAGSSFCVGADLSAETPSNLEASSITNTTATISWDAVANAASYELLIVDEDETTIDSYSGSSTSWDVTGLTAGTTYTIWWQAVNSCDDSYNSAIDESVDFTTTNNHTVSFNANGGTGSMDAVVRTHGTTYDLPGCTFVAPAGKVFKCWAEGSASGTERAVDYTHTVNADITFYAKWRDAVISDYVFSCASLTLEEHLATASTPIFITSTAEKMVRSQDYITITGNGLTPSTTLTFPGLGSKFQVLTATGGAISTDASGEIDENAYIFYTPDAGDTDDGLDKLTGLTVSVGGTKPKSATLTQDIIGRHLPTAGYVIAGKKDNKWYALPSNMASTTNPKPSEIAVDDINNPSVAYTAATNIYGLEGPTTSGAGNNVGSGNGQYIKLTMSIDDGTLDPHAAPLFGSATGTRIIGKSGNSQATSNLSAGWWWLLTQTNTSITNPQDAKYTIKCANNTSTLSLRDNAGDPDWGLFASGVEELRLIPASDIIFTEAYFVEWGQYGGVIEVDAEGIDATSVVAHLNGSTSSAITLSQTLTNGKSRATIYNYTVNFGDGIDFADNAGQMLTLEWKKGATVKAMSNIVVPKIIASNTTINSSNYALKSVWNTEVHVLPDVKLTIDASGYSPNKNVTIKELNIYPGATVDIEKDTLIATNLIMRNGWTRAGSKAYEVARLYIKPGTDNGTLKATNAYADWYIDYDQYYPIAVPWDVTISGITYRYASISATVGHDKNIRLRYYDGGSRATNGQTGVGSGANWKLYGAAGAESVPTKLEPSKGYALTAKRPAGKAFSILRMPLTIPSNAWTTLGEQGNVSTTYKNKVSVTGWGKGTAEWYAMGWNFIGNPYMCTFNGNDDGISGKLELQNGGSVKYATIPDVDFKNYDQVAIADADLKPASGFFIQANNTEAQDITFNASKIVAPAPARYTTTEETIPEQEAYIRLSYEGGKDQMGLIIGEDYTEAYEVNADLAKVLGDAGYVKTYMQYGGMDMAYVAINGELAKAWIPVTVILPTSGAYTYSLTPSSEVAELEGVYLIDYANNNKITNLINENYEFTAEAGTINNRFSINAIVGERKTPTGIDAVSAGADLNDDKPFKFVWHDKVYILHRGIIYDSTGKKVKGGAL